MQGCWEMEIREEGEDRCREIVFFFFGMSSWQMDLISLC